MDMGKKEFKILIINYEFPPLGGGGGIATYDLALEWNKFGRVDVLTSNFKDLPERETIEGINIYRTKIFFRKSRDAATFISMLSYIFTGFFKGLILAKKNKYDVINTHFAVPSGPLGYLIGKIFSIPNVLSLHGGDIYDPSKKMSPHNSFIFKRVVKFILNRADRIVAQSSNTRNNAINYYSPNKDISIIPLAFHEPLTPKIDRKSLGLNSDLFYLVTVGRLIKRKSIKTILDALSSIDNDKIKLLIIGDGPEKEYLEKITKQYNIENKVKFLGYQEDDDKFRYIMNSDVFILTSLHEGFGIVFMEAMYYGLPIVCTNHGGQVDFLKNNENAVLIDVGDINACKDGILNLFYDKNLYKKFCENNKIKVKNFYANKVAFQYIKIFRELIKK